MTVTFAGAPGMHLGGTHGGGCGGAGPWVHVRRQHRQERNGQASARVARVIIMRQPSLWAYRHGVVVDALPILAHGVSALDRRRRRELPVLVGGACGANTSQ